MVQLLRFCFECLLLAISAIWIVMFSEYDTGFENVPFSITALVFLAIDSLLCKIVIVSLCHVAGIVLSPFLGVSCGGLKCVIVPFPGHTHFLCGEIVRQHLQDHQCIFKP